MFAQAPCFASKKPRIGTFFGRGVLNWMGVGLILIALLLSLLSAGRINSNQLGKSSQLFGSIISIITMLRYCLAGCYEVMQDLIRNVHWEGEGADINVLSMVSDLAATYGFVIEENGKELFSIGISPKDKAYPQMAIAVMHEKKDQINMLTACYTFMTEACAGPNLANQELLVHSNLCRPVLKVLQYLEAEPDTAEGTGMRHRNLQSIDDHVATVQQGLADYGEHYGLELLGTKRDGQVKQELDGLLPELVLSIPEKKATRKLMIILEELDKVDEECETDILVTLTALLEGRRPGHPLYDALIKHLFVEEQGGEDASKWTTGTYFQNMGSHYHKFKEEKDPEAARHNLGNADDCTDWETAVSYYLLLRTLMVGTHNYVDELRDATKTWNDNNSEPFTQYVKRVDIVTNNSLSAIFFEAPVECIATDKSTIVGTVKKALIHRTALMNDQERVREYIRSAGMVQECIKEQYMLKRNPFTKYLVKEKLISWIALLICVVLNMLFIVGHRTIVGDDRYSGTANHRTESAENDGSSGGSGESGHEIVGHLGDANSFARQETAFLVLSRCHLVFAVLQAISYFLNHLTVERMKYSDNYKFRKPFKSAPISWMIEFLMFWLLETRATYQILAITMSIIGNFSNPSGFVFGLFELCFKVSTIQLINTAIMQSMPKLVGALILSGICTYTFAVIGMLVLPGEYNNGIGATACTIEMLDTNGTFPTCLMDHLMTFGGGIEFNDVVGGFGGFAFGMIYNIIMVLLLSNIFIGIISDQFGELRAEAMALEDKEKNECYVCSHNRTKLEAANPETGGFDGHIHNVHHPWSFVYFMMHVAQKQENKEHLTGPELLFLNAKDAEDLDPMWPLGQALSIDGANANTDTIDLKYISNQINDNKEENKSTSDQIGTMLEKMQTLTKVTSLETFALLHASSSGDLAQVQNILNMNVDVNSKDYDMRTPLHLAAAEGKQKVVELLINQQADPSAEDRFENTPITEAAKGKHMKVETLLRDRQTRVEDALHESRKRSESTVSSSGARPRTATVLNDPTAMNIGFDTSGVRGPRFDMRSQSAPTMHLDRSDDDTDDLDF
jgi:ankyrin repeat protein